MEARPSGLALANTAGNVFPFQDSMTATCSQCARPVAHPVAQGLCGRCLLRGALEPAPAATSPTEEVLRYFGDYELLQELARGGMGIVYRARQVQLNRLVALKVLAAGPLASPEFLERFRVEAEVAATLDHPNIVPIYEVGTVGDQAFFSMRLIEGGTLADQIRESPVITNERAARLLSTIARAVHYAHQRGVLHRDLKPGNVVLDSRVGPMLTDFGLAKLVEKESTVTQTQALLGTPAYMSPEQASGRPQTLTTATDIYGLGAILYELLTGQPPFGGGTTLETVRQVLEREPKPPTQLRPEVSRDLEVICLKCLEKEPTRRYGSAEALADDLDRWLRHEPIVARPIGSLERAQKWIRRHPRRASLLAVAGLALLGAALLLTFFNLRLRAANHRAAEQAEENRTHLVQFNVSKGVDLMNQGDLFGSLPWFVEALHLDQGHPEREEVHRTRIAAVLNHAPKLIQILAHPTTNASASFFSPDGRRVIVRHGEAGFAQAWDLTSGQAITPPLQHTGTLLLQPMFNSRGDRILTGGQEGTARIWDAQTGQPVCPPLTHAPGMMVARFSPDDRLVLTAGGDEQLRIFDADTGELRRVIRLEESAKDAVFRPDGKEILSCSQSGKIWVHDVSTGQLRLTQQHPPTASGRWVRYSANGRRFLSSSGQGAVVWDSATGQALTPLLTHQGLWMYGAELNADGTRLLSWGRDATARLWDVSTNRISLPVLRHDHGVRMAEFSPDGNRVVTACEDQFVRVWDVSTGELAAAPFRHSGKVFRASFSPEGDRILSSDETTTKLWSLAHTATEVSLLVEDRPRGASFLENGTLLIVDGNRNLQAWNLSDGMEKAVPRPVPPNQLPVLKRTQPFERLLSPDGRTELLKTSLGIRVGDPATGQELTPNLKHRESVNSAVFSADSRRIATGSEDQTARVWDALTGWPVTPSLRLESGVHHVQFAPDGQSLLTFSGSRLVTLWRLPSDPRPTAELRKLAELLSGRRINSSGGMMDLGPDQFSELWTNVRNQFPQEFQVSPRQLAQWQWCKAMIAEFPDQVHQFLNPANDRSHHARLARWHLSLRRWKPAESELTEALRWEPERAEWSIARARCRTELGDLTGAAADLEQALRSAPESAAAWFGRARVRMAQTRREEALSDVREALERSPDDPVFLELQGQIQRSLQQWDNSIQSFARARDQRAVFPAEEERLSLRRIPARPPGVGPNQVDLGRYFTAPLRPGWMVPNPQGESSGDWPEGVLSLGGQTFDVRGVIQLAGSESQRRLGSFPSRVEGIPIRRTIRALHFLHGTHPEPAENEAIGTFVLHRADGTTERLPIVNNRHLRWSWTRIHTPLPDTNSVVAWKSETTGSLRPKSLFRTTWINSRPETEVVMLDYESDMKITGPFLVAITVEPD